MIRYRYNQQVSPPAPFVHVTIRRPSDEASVPDLPAQIDTPVDMTVIPGGSSRSSSYSKHGEIETLGSGGHVTSVTSFLVRLQIHQLDPVTVEVLADRDEPYVLKERDMLNRNRVVLDGPG